MTSDTPNTSLTPDELRKMNAYWRAANYLSVGQIYLMDNPLLKEPLKLEHTKPRLLGHGGTTPGLNFIYAHFNRVIQSLRSERHLHLRSGARRSRDRGKHVYRRDLFGDLSKRSAKRSRHEAAVHAVLVSRHSEPR